MSIALTAVVLGSFNSYAATSESAAADDMTEQIAVDTKKEVKKTGAKIIRTQANPKARIKKSSCKLSKEKAFIEPSLRETKQKYTSIP